MCNLFKFCCSTLVVPPAWKVESGIYTPKLYKDDFKAHHGISLVPSRPTHGLEEENILDRCSAPTKTL